MPINTTFLKQNKIPLLLTVVSILFYGVFAYSLERTEYIKLITLHTALFIIFYKLIDIGKHNTKYLSLIAVIFRAVFILAIPNLSQDFYRFLWDGRLLIQGINPYLYTPESFISAGEYPVAQAKALYTGMQSLNASHFTNYPPVNQLCFALAALLSGKSIAGSAMVLRLLIIAADFGTLYFGKKLLKAFNLPTHTIFWYILNPFIIIELTGNLHFEGVMIFFLIWSLYLLHTGYWKWAAVIFALSIATKLVPLMFLPLFFWWFVKHTSILKNTENTHLGVLKLIGFYAIIGVSTVLLFIPFFSSEFITNYSKTVGLWFGKFEFNASIYYLARSVGYVFRGWNEIEIIGKILPVLVFLFITSLALLRKNNTTKKLITAMLFAFTFYLFTSTTVHPWYVATILALSIFTRYKFAIVWSFIVIISYLAYANTENSENLWIIALEYIIVYSVFIWEFFFQVEKRSI